MVGFVVAELGKAAAKPDAAHQFKGLHTTGLKLEGLYGTLALPEFTLPLSVCDQFEANTRAFMLWWKRGGGKFTIKHHYALHITEQVRRFGNARYWHSYADERFNRIIKRRCYLILVPPTEVAPSSK